MVENPIVEMAVSAQSHISVPQASGVTPWHRWLELSHVIANPMAQIDVVLATGGRLDTAKLHERAMRLPLEIVNDPDKLPPPPYAEVAGPANESQPTLKVTWALGDPKYNYVSVQAHKTQGTITVRGRKVAFTPDRVRRMLQHLGGLKEVKGTAARKPAAASKGAIAQGGR